MSDLTVMQAIRDIAILPNAIVPTTTLTAQATQGTSTALQVTDSSAFMIGGRLWFNDALGEEGLPITGKTATTITVSFAGTGYSGFQHTHANGTQVYTNLQINAPVEIAPSLAGGSPYVFLWVLNERVVNRALKILGSIFTVRVQEHRRLARSATQTGLDANLWAERQETALRTDLETIAQTIRLSRSLGGRILDIGMPSQSSGQVMSKSWQRIGETLDTQQFVGALDVIVQDFLGTPSGP